MNAGPIGGRRGDPGIPTWGVCDALFLPSSAETGECGGKLGCGVVTNVGGRVGRWNRPGSSTWGVGPPLLPTGSSTEGILARSTSSAWATGGPEACDSLVRGDPPGESGVRLAAAPATAEGTRAPGGASVRRFCDSPRTACGGSLNPGASGFQLDAGPRSPPSRSEGPFLGVLGPSSGSVIRRAGRDRVRSLPTPPRNAWLSLDADCDAESCLPSTAPVAPTVRATASAPAPAPRASPMRVGEGSGATTNGPRGRVTPVSFARRRRPPCGLHAQRTCRS